MKDDRRRLPLNPRFARYHQMVSAPELWNAAAVREALDQLAAQNGRNLGPENGEASDDASDQSRT
jgi:hypothetical protein